ncbi:MAG: prolyl-tRNA synthetase associated domain-containing protein [Desulfobacterales bacterium]
MSDLLNFLDDHKVQYDHFQHEAVFTVADVQRLLGHIPGTKTKNLFFRDQKGNRHFLVVVPDELRVDMKALAKVLDAKRISFGSPDRLREHLGLEPGAVSLLAVFNDQPQNVELFIDRGLWANDQFQFHPLVNTATLVVDRANLEKFLVALNRDYKVVDVPARSED